MRGINHIYNVLMLADIKCIKLYGLSKPQAGNSLSPFATVVNKCKKG